MNNEDLEGLEEGLMMSGGNDKVGESGLKPNQHLTPGFITPWSLIGL